MRGVTSFLTSSLKKLLFQLTRLVRGVTRVTVCASSAACSFQLTRLVRGVTIPKPYSLQREYKISTHTPRERRDIFRKLPAGWGTAFQLTRLVRGVTSISANTSFFIRISTHTPRERRDAFRNSTAIPEHEFQLTRLVRGVTFRGRGAPRYELYFNSHAS